jgi:hypothetical protein
MKARKIYLHTKLLLHSLLGITLPHGHHFRKFQKDGEMQLAIGKRKPGKRDGIICTAEKQQIHKNCEPRVLR